MTVEGHADHAAHLYNWALELKKHLEIVAKRLKLERKRGDLLRRQNHHLRARLREPDGEQLLRGVPMEADLYWRGSFAASPRNNSGSPFQRNSGSCVSTPRNNSGVGTPRNNSVVGTPRNLPGFGLGVKEPSEAGELSCRMAAVETERDEILKMFAALDQRLSKLQKAHEEERGKLKLECESHLAEASTTITELQTKLANALNEKQGEQARAAEQLESLRKEIIELKRQKPVKPLQTLQSSNLPDVVSTLTSDAGRFTESDEMQSMYSACSSHKLLEAIAHNEVDIVRSEVLSDTQSTLLFKTDSSIGGMPLHLAVQQGSSEAAVCILESLQRMAQLDQYQMMIHAEMQQRRLKNTIDGTNIDGRTPLALLMRKKSPDEQLARKLLIAKASPLNRDVDGKTPFLECVTSGHENITKMLLSASQGVVLLECDNMGRTPLHCAAEAGHRGVVELLLKANVDPEASDKQGFTACNAAQAAGHADLVELLSAVPEPSNMSC